MTGHYVDSLDTAPLIEKAISSMLEELDPHSTYLSADKVRDAAVQLGKGFGGIGIETRIIRDTLTVTNILPDTPADRFGIRPDDRIVAVDNKTVTGIDLSKAIDMLRGNVGSKVELKIVRRHSAAPVKIEVTRARIHPTTVPAAYRINDSVGYVKISRFGHSTPNEFLLKTDALGNIKGLIIDLRGNGGGVMAAATRIANNFLDKGQTIVSTEGRKSPYRAVKATGTGKYRDIQPVILIDGSSASASEILAGALQDWDRAVIVGQKSFGKGLVQRQHVLDDGSAIRLTVSRYLTPCGRAIQRPYKPGHRKEYYLRTGNYDSDSICKASRPKYKTLRLGRDVFGENGITPDIETTEERAHVTPFLADIIANGSLHEAIYDMLARDGERLKASFPDFESFAHRFTVTDSLAEEIIGKGRYSGANMDGSDSKPTIEYIKRLATAMTARRLFSASEYYRILNSSSDKALEQAAKAAGEHFIEK